MIEGEIGQTPEVRKPDVLYHASPDSEIEVFEPRQDKVRDPLEGPVVFATPDRAFATCFLVPTDDSWARISRFSENGVPGSWKVIVSDRDRFKQLDHGGSIYHLPVDTFNSDTRYSMGETEWTSREAVTPIGKEDFESGLTAMRDAGVEVSFVDEQTFKDIVESDDHGKAIIESL